MVGDLNGYYSEIERVKHTENQSEYKRLMSIINKGRRGVLHLNPEETFSSSHGHS